MRLDFAKATGLGPRQFNEDAVGQIWLGHDSLAVSVADGLGGMGGGAKASQLAIDAFVQCDFNHLLSSEDLLAAVKNIHEKIVTAQQTDEGHRKMATTFTAAVIRDQKLFGAHCGDTRLIIARGKGIQRLTSDHSEGMRLLKAGKISKDEYVAYPRKHILDSALGSHKEPIIDTFMFPLQVFDKIVITSDGMHQKVKLRELRDVLALHSDPASFVLEAESLLISRAPDDNYSIAAIFCN